MARGPEHLTHHFWLTADGSVLCKPCGATYRASKEEVQRFSMAGSRAFMEQHRSCVQAASVKVQIPYRAIPNAKGGSS